MSPRTIGHSPSQPVRLTAPSWRGPRMPAGNCKRLTDFPHPRWGQKCIEFRCHCEPERAWRPERAARGSTLGVQSPGTIHRGAPQYLSSYREIATPLRARNDIGRRNPAALSNSFVIPSKRSASRDLCTSLASILSLVRRSFDFGLTPFAQDDMETALAMTCISS